MRMISVLPASSVFDSARNEQPTPQYAQVVVVAFSALPMATIDFSINAPVGQDSTQAPQETHSESMKDSFWLADTFEPKPRPWIVSAKVPCTSSHARTQREQTMHSSGLKPKYRSEEHTSELQSQSNLVCRL